MPRLRIVARRPSAEEIESAALLHAAPYLSDSVISTNLLGEIVGFNPGAEHLLCGGPPIIGERIESLLRISAPTEAHGRDTTVNLFKTVLRTKAAVSLEDVAVMCDDIGQVPVSCIAAPVWIDGEMVGVVLILRDLRESKRSQSMSDRRAELFRTLAESGGSMVWTTGRDGRPDFVSERWLRYTGFTREAMCGRADVWLAVLHPEDKDEVAAAFTAALERNLAFTMTARVRCAYDGTFRWHSFGWFPVRHSTQDTPTYLMVCTELNEAPDLNEYARVRRSELNRAIHELRNLVSPIAVATTLLKAPEPAIRNRSIELIERQIDKLAKALAKLEQEANENVRSVAEGTTSPHVG
jgi:PAS domain S-box-containing protein